MMGPGCGLHAHSIQIPSTCAVHGADEHCSLHVRPSRFLPASLRSPRPRHHCRSVPHLAILQVSVSRANSCSLYLLYNCPFPTAEMSNLWEIPGTYYTPDLPCPVEGCETPLKPNNSKLEWHLECEHAGHRFICRICEGANHGSFFSRNRCILCGMGDIDTVSEKSHFKSHYPMKSSSKIKEFKEYSGLMHHLKRTHSIDRPWKQYAIDHFGIAKASCKFLFLPITRFRSNVQL